ncbi:hypothetical protein J7E97_21845 [Streptomyces sp. ISL-66]|uniref:hypothetical protein n=1 Tax=Streptomyces sp. ISL-66 TaxID=2819186 RepID=UPI001BE8D857|nr:hypothetical protein [Streptomyces sp. ISL-66]MBT2470444.1 hypothetical protein [Streptomyces sp. ISL-66]
MSDDRAHQLEELRTLGLLPDSWVCVFEAGSLVRGWGNASSDVDLYVVSEEPWTGGGASRHPVPLTPSAVLGEETFVGAMRWDIRYWTRGQVEQVLAKATWEAFERGAEELSLREVQLLDRLAFGAAAGGGELLARWRVEAEGSAFRSIVASRILNMADSRIEDAVGQLEAGDLESAVLSARAAFHYTVDALLASEGECGPGEKWRARKLRATAPDVLPFDTYWALETMRSFDPEQPGLWINEVLTVCRGIAMEVDI